MQMKLPLTLAVLILTSACSSGSNDTTTGSTQSATSLLPATLPNRITSIELDVEMDGSIDVTSTMSYDAQGRISNRTIEYGPAIGRSDSITDFLYSAGQLVEIKTNNASEMFTYANDMLVNYQYISASFEEQKSYRYDSNGRLVGTSGENAIYSDGDCESDTDFSAEPVPEPDLVLNYTNNRLSSITSSNNVLNEVYTYDAAGRISKISSSYACPNSENNFTDTLVINYNDKGLVTSIEQTSVEDIYRAEVTYDESDRPIKIVSSYEGIFTNFGNSVDTQTITYNEQGLPTAIESTSVPTSQFSPNTRSTITYEDQSCVVALTADPLIEVASAAFAMRPTNTDPALCLFPLDN